MRPSTGRRVAGRFHATHVYGAGGGVGTRGPAGSASCRRACVKDQQTAVFRH